MAPRSCPSKPGLATTTRTGKLLQWLRTDAAKIRNGSPSAEWPHPSLAAFVLAHGQPFAAGDIGSSLLRVVRSLAATHWRVHGAFQHREPCLNAQRCLFLDELERFVYAEGFVPDDRAGYPEPYEAMKALARGRALTLADLHTFIQQLDVSAELKDELLALRPETYVGLAARLARLKV